MKQLLARVVFLVLGLGIMFFSITKTALEISAKDNNDEKVRKRAVFLAIQEGSDRQGAVYWLPVPGVLPDSPLYWIKSIRNGIWMNLTKGTDRSEVALLLADKKWTEAMKLIEEGEYKWALEAGNEALNKLEYANRTLSEIEEHKIDWQRLHRRIYVAGYAYRELLNEPGEKLTGQGWKDLIKRIDDWNKKQEEEKSTWSS